MRPTASRLASSRLRRLTPLPARFPARSLLATDCYKAGGERVAEARPLRRRLSREDVLLVAPDEPLGRGTPAQRVVEQPAALALRELDGKERAGVHLAVQADAEGEVPGHPLVDGDASVRVGADEVGARGGEHAEPDRHGEEEAGERQQDPRAEEP